MGQLKSALLIICLFLFGFLAFGVSILALLIAPFFPKLRFWLNPFFFIPFGFFARKIVGVHLEVLNPENKLNDAPGVYIGNHQTALDMAILGSICPFGTIIVGKKEIQYIPIFGWYFKIAGNLLINRSSSKDAKQSLESIRDTLVSRGVNLAVFPEGTRSKNQSILPFKKGAFHMAVSTGLPLIPIVCSSLKGIAIWEKAELAGGLVMVSVLPPIETKNITDLDAFCHQVRNQMIAEFDRINHLVATHQNSDPKPGAV